MNENSDASKMQKDAATHLHTMINDQADVTINLVRKSSDVLIGDCDNATIDLFDAENFSQYVDKGAECVVMHETSEQYFLKSYPARKPIKAHLNAVGFETIYVNGGTEGTFDLSDLNNDKSGYGKYTYYDLDYIDPETKLYNREKSQKTILIPFKKRQCRQTEKIIFEFYAEASNFLVLKDLF